MHRGRLPAAHPSTLNCPPYHRRRGRLTQKSSHGLLQKTFTSPPSAHAAPTSEAAPIHDLFRPESRCHAFCGATQASIISKSPITGGLYGPTHGPAPFRNPSGKLQKPKQTEFIQCLDTRKSQENSRTTRHQQDFLRDDQSFGRRCYDAAPLVSYYHPKSQPA